MKRIATMLALVTGLGILAGCSDERTREENRRKAEAEEAEEEITEMLETVLAGVRKVDPAPYHANLCEEQKKLNTLEELRQDWTDQRQLLLERMGGVKL